MINRKKSEEEKENLERWLLTYADLITLLLAFFVMLYVFSKQDTKKYDAMTMQLKAIFSGGTGVVDEGGRTGSHTIESATEGPSDIEIRRLLEKQIKGLVQAEGLQENISIITDERGIVIRIMDRAFYDTGKADLKVNARSTLDSIAPVIKTVPNEIRIEGHTDNVPISTIEFRSNWELSVRRATEVVKYLVENGGISPKRISAAGYAEYRPVAENDTEVNRALNRRIEIIVLNTAG
ncbi:MAG: OmpA family protein [Deltaproteobacteria bacterium]|nr:OmpA family protein [Deltaproteobacteria bacterium]